MSKHKMSVKYVYTIKGSFVGVLDQWLGGGGPCLVIINN